MNKKRGRPTTNKIIQTHFSCACGYNAVDHESLPIRWKDFSAARITRKIDKSTGKPFLLMRQVSNECHCNDFGL